MSEITIHGLKFDLIPRPEVSTLRVGDRVKVLIKNSYGNDWNAYRGVIMSVDNFQTHPTVNIVYLDISYSSCSLKTVAFNDGTENVEIAVIAPDDKSLDIDQGTIMEMFERQIEIKKRELADIMYKQAYFEKNFGKFFGGI